MLLVICPTSTVGRIVTAIGGGALMICDRDEFIWRPFIIALYIEFEIIQRIVNLRLDLCLPPSLGAESLN